MATLLKSKKRTKPKIIELNDPIVNTDETIVEPIADNSSNANTRATTSESHVIDINDSPSAPPEDQIPAFKPTGLADPLIRADFMVKVYSVLFFQKLSFSALIALFTYIPHMRKVARKLIFDPLFLSSMIGYPLIVIPIILMLIWPSFRRKVAVWTFVTLTICISLLLSYAITEGKAIAFLYSMGFNNVCDLGVIAGSKLKRDLTKRRYILLNLMAMFGVSALAPTLLKTSINNTIWPSIMTTFGSTYLHYNTRPVIHFNDLELKPEEYVFAASQLYLNPERSVRHKIKSWFFPSAQDRDRRGYEPIG